MFRYFPFTADALPDHGKVNEVDALPAHILQAVTDLSVPVETYTNGKPIDRKFERLNLTLSEEGASTYRALCLADDGDPQITFLPPMPGSGVLPPPHLALHVQAEAQTILHVYAQLPAGAFGAHQPVPALQPPLPHPPVFMHHASIAAHACLDRIQDPDDPVNCPAIGACAAGTILGTLQYTYANVVLNIRVARR